MYIIQNITAGPSFDVVTSQTFPRPATINFIKKAFGAGRLVIEGNIIELVAVDAGSAPTNALAFGIGDSNGGTNPSPEAPDYPNGDIIIRNNKVRYLDGAFNSGYLGYGSDISGVKNLQTLNNVIDCAPSNPLRNARVGAATYFNNLTTKGVLVQGFKSDAPTKTYDELQTQADDALVMAFAEW
ncbi:MAG: hypothetical protein HY299_23030 [Verrucomicrobia bacterium]|nr:hypothetical protein [Verrucomicrobiota bacterium]